MYMSVCVCDRERKRERDFVQPDVEALRAWVTLRGLWGLVTQWKVERA